MVVERTMTSELQRLKQEMRERGHARPQDEEIINALKEQVRNTHIAHSDICMVLYTMKIYSNNSPTLILQLSMHACLLNIIYQLISDLKFY